MITAARLEALMRHAATATRMIIDDGRPTLQGIDLHEMGDGSHRWAAFVHGLREHPGVLHRVPRPLERPPAPLHDALVLALLGLGLGDLVGHAGSVAARPDDLRRRRSGRGAARSRPGAGRPAAAAPGT